MNSHYCKAIVSISDNIESRFEDIKQSPIFQSMVLQVETQTWPTGNVNEFGDKDIIKITNHFRDLLSKNGRNLNVTNEEWQVLKTFMVPLINNNKNSGKESFLTSKQKKNVVMCCTYSNHFLSFLLQMPNWENVFENVVCENRLEKSIK